MMRRESTVRSRATGRPAPSAAARRFLRCERGGVALESALALFVLTGAFAILMPIFTTVFTEDRASRGARAVARAIAIDPGADPWAVLVREGELDAGATCPAWDSDDDTTHTCDGRTLKVHHGVSPATLDEALTGGATAAGEMVLVRLERAPAQGGGNTVFGVARREPSA